MKQKNKDPVYRATRQILRQLVWQPQPVLPPCLCFAVPGLLERQARLELVWNRLVTADRRGWRLAAHQLRADWLREAALLNNQLGEVLRQPALRDVTRVQELHPLPTWQTLMEELRQLEQEFGHVEFRLKEHLIVAHTEPIELAGLSLGLFAIELHLKQLGSNPDTSCFRCVALQPYPASSDEAVTHPHVKDASLCAGEATVPIAAALRQGRICDAFCLVRAVLSEYNSRSPFIAIEDWDGVRCQDCGCSVSREETYYCEGCGNDTCGDCNGCCDVCDGSYCRGCLERDDVSRRLCCPGCQQNCSACGRMVDPDSFETETKLCPQCHEELETAAEPPEREESSDANTPIQDTDSAPSLSTDSPQASAVSDSISTLEAIA